jgi:hypothetical protein
MRAAVGALAVAQSEAAQDPHSISGINIGTNEFDVASCRFDIGISEFSLVSRC